MDEINTKDLRILDTFKISGSGIHFKKLHIQRTLEAFDYLKNNFLTDNRFTNQSINQSLSSNDYVAIYDHIENKHKNLQKEMKVRLSLTLNDLKQSDCEISDLDQLPLTISSLVTLEISKINFQKSGLGIQNFKTNQRQFWDQALKASHCFDVIGVNDLGFVTETSRFNLFLLKDQIIYTPTLNSGCLNGVFRRHLLNLGFFQISNIKNIIIEKDIPLKDLNNYEIYVGNSLRGMHKAILI